ncbi:hypothetical protein [Glycomyces dulcitolivorans]|uniref:hypothetical protein n=1 Tax=Glycomyces dulcitolivorans TaxID=2200759 RepID=UPI0013001A1F|nr:hypothetical protein [Glycomyces dulcitolivorans]
MPVRLCGQDALGVLLLLARGRTGGLQVLVQQAAGVGGEFAGEGPHPVALLCQLDPLQRLLAQALKEFGLLGQLGGQLVKVALEFFEGGVSAVLGDQGLRGLALHRVVKGGDDRSAEGGPSEQPHRRGPVELADGEGDLVDPGLPCRCRLNQYPELP